MRCLLSSVFFSRFTATISESITLMTGDAAPRWSEAQPRGILQETLSRLDALLDRGVAVEEPERDARWMFLGQILAAQPLHRRDERARLAGQGQGKPIGAALVAS